MGAEMRAVVLAGQPQDIRAFLAEPARRTYQHHESGPAKCRRAVHQATPVECRRVLTMATSGGAFYNHWGGRRYRGARRAVQMEANPSVPDTSTEVAADTKQLERVFLNIL